MPNTCQANTLGQTGDTKIIWDKNKPSEVAAAKKLFDELKSKGYLAFSVKNNGDKDTLLKDWDPKAERLILTPPVVGG